MRAWLTSEVAAADTICRRFSVPVNLIPYFMGALDELTNSKNWERYDLLTPDEEADLFLSIVNTYQDGCMVGTIFHYLTDTPPVGSLALDGGTYNNADYPKLVDAGISAWDNGDGTFTLPDGRGRGVIGSGTGTGLTARTMGDLIGQETVYLEEADLPAHHHGLVDPGSVVVEAGIGAIALADPGLPSVTDNTGGDGAHENMQPSIAFPMAVWVS